MKKSASACAYARLFVALLMVWGTSAVFAQAPEGVAANLPAEAKAASVATVNPKPALESCKVKNFGQVTEQYFRGAQPKQEEYAQLAALGVKTVIDLRDETERFAKTKAEAAGLVYINVPMSDTKYPPEETVARFLSLVKDQTNFPIFVHCRGGRHRTGALTAVYRMTFQGWDINKAYEEMKDYDFYTRWGHKAMKTFVFDYWNKLQAQRKEAAAQTSPATVIP
jgi:protein tyrosine/serine phosphatase